MNLLTEPRFLVGLAIANLFAIALWLASRSRVVFRRRRSVGSPAASLLVDERSMPTPSTTSADDFSSRGEADLAARVARWRKRSESPMSGRALDEWILEAERAEQSARARSVGR